MNLSKSLAGKRIAGLERETGDATAVRLFDA
jgi:hypothetical protein